VDTLPGRQCRGRLLFNNLHAYHRAPLRLCLDKQPQRLIVTERRRTHGFTAHAHRSDPEGQITMTTGNRAASGRPVEDDVSELVIGAREGDQIAWGHLVDRYARLVYAVALRCRLTHADAADVSQTVWLRLAENLHRINDPSRVGAWLVTTTKRECLALIKARSRYEPMDVSTMTLVDPSAGPDEIIARAESITEVAAAFALLTERCRELLRRLVIESESYQQIAADLEMPIGSIGPTRIRCLSLLRRHLEEAPTHEKQPY